MVSVSRILNIAWRHGILQIGFVQDTEPHVSAWFNRPLSSCKRRQGEAYLYLVTLPTPFLQKLFPCPDCPVLEGFTVRVTPLQTPPLSPGFTFLFQLQITQDCCVPILRPTPSKKNLHTTMTNLIDSVCPIFFFQVEQKGCHIHNCGGGYLIWST